MKSVRIACVVICGAIGSSLLAQTANDILTDRIINTVNLWATVVGVLSALAIGAATFNVIYQFTQVRKTGENLAAELLSRVEKELQKMKETYNLASLRTPEQILADVRRDYEPMIAAAKSLAEHARRDSESSIDEIRTELAALRELIESERAHVRGEMVQREIITGKHVQEQVGILTRYVQDQVGGFRPPADMEETILRKVLNAFIQVQDLSVEERRAISDVLTVAPGAPRAATSTKQEVPTLVT